MNIYTQRVKSRECFTNQEEYSKIFLSVYDLFFQSFLWARLEMKMLLQKVFHPLCNSYWTKGYHTRLLQAVLPKSLLLSAHTWRCLFSFYQRNGINQREVAASQKRSMKYCLNCRFTFISYMFILSTDGHKIAIFGTKCTQGTKMYELKIFYFNGHIIWMKWTQKVCPYICLLLFFGTYIPITR